MSDVFTRHRLTLCDGQYEVAIRSFIHKGSRLYQAGVREDYHINYQVQGTRSEVFQSLKDLFKMYAAAEEQAL